MHDEDDPTLETTHRNVSARVQAVVQFSGSDFAAWRLRREVGPTGAGDGAPVYSPTAAPILVMHGTEDGLVPYGEAGRIAAGYASVGRPFALCPLSGYGHVVPNAIGFDNVIPPDVGCVGSAEGAKAVKPGMGLLEASLAFLAEHLKSDGKAPTEGEHNPPLANQQSEICTPDELERLSSSFCAENFTALAVRDEGNDAAGDTCAGLRKSECKAVGACSYSKSRGECEPACGGRSKKKCVKKKKKKKKKEKEKEKEKSCVWAGGACWAK